MRLGRACLPPSERAEITDTEEYPTWATRLGQEFQAKVVMATRLYHVFTGQTQGQT